MGVIGTPVGKPSWRQATRASALPKLELHTPPQAPSQKTCRAPVTKPLTSILLASLTSPSAPASRGQDF